jgi:luciferase family oxidoreductase group 1
MIPFSILDLSPIVQGGDARAALEHSRDLARHAENLGYHRYWVAEHHNLPGVASAATAVVICHIANATRRIRVGAGGIMLPNHAPLIIAEQFGTLESLFPGRIDLGLGRAPGSDPSTARAIRRGLGSNPDDFGQDVQELMGYFAPASAESAVRAVPGAGLAVPLWILGSSLFGAQVAAALGLPFAFASHFAPAMLMPAIELYRAQFRPATAGSRPYVMLGFNVLAADTDEEAQLLATSVQQAFVNLRTGRPSALPPPQSGYLEHLPPTLRTLLGDILACSAIGSPATVRERLAAFIARTRPDELMLTGQIYDHAARVHSFEIAASVREALEPARETAS